MVKGVVLSRNEQEFLLQLLAQGKRLDGREIEQFRDVEIKLGEEYGYVDVKLGRSRVVVRISSEIVKPFEDRPFEGIFNINIELNSNLLLFSSSDNDELLIQRMIEKSIKRSNSLDLESLCIIAGKFCWSIKADLHFIEFDGNFIDISNLAVIVGLLHFKLNNVTINNNQNASGGSNNDQQYANLIIHPINEIDPISLSILHIPISITFSFYTSTSSGGDTGDNDKDNDKDQSVICLLDASLKEEMLRQSFLIITMNKNKEVCQILKNGGLPIDALTILNCCNRAVKIVDELTEKIKSTLKEDQLRRLENVPLDELRAENARQTNEL
ncbi:exosome non-catalytic core subunit RRP45 [Ascoidea rubescens DSM 1968]|uniref:Ribosomal protein S5 domain 2-like protein n=1 Tax=Ascoidea rubescens DSM 1968 TaxID=1344418 RepID=A0A1D2V9L9_9ASCO|nr:ribosomal protein S5 domain 2-like protein [Ascoidea rubescens DSM 1968]ODV58269.1 ribosomal protein S5 domain 2-like protein [Ascoidea rubescens DSM 1968]